MTKLFLFAFLLGAFATPIPAAKGGTKLPGIVLLNELEGPPLGDVEITADGASPAISGTDGRFELDFGNNRQPGDAVELVVRKKGHVVVHNILLKHVLPRDATQPRVKILLSEDKVREEMARRYFRLRFEEATASDYRKKMEQLKRGQQDDAANIARLQSELEETKAAAAGVAEQLARRPSEQQSSLYDEALKLFVDGKPESALNLLDETKLNERKAKAQVRAREVSKEYQLRGDVLDVMRDQGGAGRAYEAAVELAPDDYFALGKLGFLQFKSQQQDKAQASWERALKAEREANDSQVMGTTLFNLAGLYKKKNNFAGARQAFDEALAIYREFQRTDKDNDYRPLIAIALDGLGDLPDEKPDDDRAIKAHEDAANIWRELSKIADSHRLNLGKTLNDLGMQYLAKKRLDDASKALDESLIILREEGKTNHRAQELVPKVLMNLGLVYHRAGEDGKARQRFKDALSIWRNLRKGATGLGSPEEAQAYRIIGEFYEDESQRADASDADRKSRRAEARDAYTEAKDIWQKLTDRGTTSHLPDIAKTLNRMAALEWNDGRFADSCQMGEEALGIWRSLSNSPAIASTLYSLGMSNIGRKEMDEAEKALKEALTIYQQLAQQAPEKYKQNVENTKNLLSALEK